MLTPSVKRAIDEIREVFPGHTAVVEEDGDGGARVLVEDIELGSPYSQATTWVAFHITFQYPSADVYPHFVRGDLSRADGEGLGDATSSSEFMTRPAIQISRRSNRLNPLTDTALHKMTKVLDWLRQRP